MKKCKVYLKDVKCPHCRFFHNELKATEIYGDRNKLYKWAAIVCVCKHCGNKLEHKTTVANGG